MEIKTVDYRALSLVGLSIKVVPGETQIPSLWGALMRRMQDISGLVQNGLSYGISTGMDPDGGFTYVAAMEAQGQAPEGMVKIEYPARTYAVFDCTMGTISEVYGRIFSEWLPASRWQPDDEYSFELYGIEFDPQSLDSVFQVYVPVAAR